MYYKSYTKSQAVWYTTVHSRTANQTTLTGTARCYKSLETPAVKYNCPSLYLIKHDALNEYGGVEVQLHLFLTSARDVVVSFTPPRSSPSEFHLIRGLVRPRVVRTYWRKRCFPKLEIETNCDTKRYGLPAAMLVPSSSAPQRLHVPLAPPDPPSVALLQHLHNNWTLDLTLPIHNCRFVYCMR